MNVFVTGAAGFIGGSIASGLVKAGHQVTGLVRSPEQAEELKAIGITAVIGSTPATSTSPSCSTQPKMPFNSPSIAAASASLIAMRASDAIFLTVA